LYEQTIEQSRKTNAPNPLSQTKKAVVEGQKSRTGEVRIVALATAFFRHPEPPWAALFLWSLVPAAGG